MVQSLAFSPRDLKIAGSNLVAAERDWCVLWKDTITVSTILKTLKAILPSTSSEKIGFKPKFKK